MNEYKTYAIKEVEGEVMVGTGERERQTSNLNIY